MEFNEMRKRCKFHRTHGERMTSSGLRFEELCSLRGKCSLENCVYNMSAGGNEHEQRTSTKKAR